MKTQEKVENLLQENFSPIYLQIQDESAKHAGHHEAGNSLEGSHFSVLIVSRVFSGQGLIDRHKAIYQVLQGPMETIHALAIKAYSPEEW